MKQASTLFLRVVLIGIGLPILGICILLLPKIAMEAFGAIGDRAYTLGFIVLGILLITYIAAVPFYMSLYQTWKLLTYIDTNRAFSELSVDAIKIIKNCGKIICILYIIALPLLYIVAEWDDAPGLIAIGLIISGASLVIAVFAAVLQRLLQEAIRIKQENDLTV